MQPRPSTVDLWFLDPIPTDVFAAWGQWAGGFGSIAAVIVALWIVQRDSRRARKAEESQRAARASAIFTAMGELGPPLGEQRATLSDSYYGIKIENHGSTPILDVKITEIMVTTPDYDQPHPDWHLSEEEADRLPIRVADIVAAGETVYCEVAAIARILTKFEASGAILFATISFQDADGYRWYRTGRRKPFLFQPLVSRSAKLGKLPDLKGPR